MVVIEATVAGVIIGLSSIASLAIGYITGVKTTEAYSSDKTNIQGKINNVVVADIKDTVQVENQKEVLIALYAILGLMIFVIVATGINFFCTVLEAK